MDSGFGNLPGRAGRILWLCAVRSSRRAADGIHATAVLDSPIARQFLRRASLRADGSGTWLGTARGDASPPLLRNQSHVSAASRAVGTFGTSSHAGRNRSVAADV